MRLTLRLYKRWDLDLLYLYQVQNESFDFKDELKATLKGYIHGKPIKHKEIPTGESPAVAALPTFIQLHINLDAKKDKDVIKWLQNITKGRRNNIVKNVFRNSYPVIELPYNVISENNKIETKGEKDYDTV